MLLRAERKAVGETTTHISCLLRPSNNSLMYFMLYHYHAQRLKRQAQHRQQTFDALPRMRSAEVDKHLHSKSCQHAVVCCTNGLLALCSTGRGAIIAPCVVLPAHSAHSRSRNVQGLQNVDNGPAAAQPCQIQRGPRDCLPGPQIGINLVASKSPTAKHTERSHGILYIEPLLRQLVHSETDVSRWGFCVHD